MSLVQTLFVTSSIVPAIPMACHDPKLRLYQTQMALTRLYESQVFDKVIFIDSSNYPVASFLKLGLPGEWINYYSFKTDNVEGQISKYGYGYGELLIYEKLLQILPASRYPIYKISGRYSIANIGKIIPKTMEYDNFFFTFYPRFAELKKYVHTSFYKITLENLSASTYFCKQLIEQYPWMPLEKAMAIWIIRSNKDRRFRALPNPRYEAITAFTGRNLSNRPFPYSFFCKLEAFPLMAFSC